MTVYICRNKKDAGAIAKRFLYTRLTFSQPMMVTVGVAKLDYSCSTFIDTAVIINEMYYCESVMCFFTTHYYFGHQFFTR